MGEKKSRITVRITPNQELVLGEMSEALGTSISMLIRTIIGSWLATNEEHIYRIIDKKKEDAYYKQDSKETEIDKTQSN
jgi:hypothetical protein